MFPIVLLFMYTFKLNFPRQHQSWWPWWHLLMELHNFLETSLPSCLSLFPQTRFWLLFLTIEDQSFQFERTPDFRRAMWTWRSRWFSLYRSNSKLWRKICYFWKKKEQVTELHVSSHHDALDAEHMTWGFQVAKVSLQLSTITCFFRTPNYVWSKSCELHCESYLLPTAVKTCQVANEVLHH